MFDAVPCRAVPCRAMPCQPAPFAMRISRNICANQMMPRYALTNTAMKTFQAQRVPDVQEIVRPSLLHLPRSFQPVVCKRSHLYWPTLHPFHIPPSLSPSLRLRRHKRTHIPLLLPRLSLLMLLLLRRWQWTSLPPHISTIRSSSMPRSMSRARSRWRPQFSSQPRTTIPTSRPVSQKRPMHTRGDASSAVSAVASFRRYRARDGAVLFGAD